MDVYPGVPSDEAERRFVIENRSTSPIPRLIDPQEIADVVAFVCSPKAAAINGTAVRADGGIVRNIL